MISIAGASGSVGRLVVEELARIGVGNLRLGGRRREALLEVARTAPDSEVLAFDLLNEEESRQFCEGSTIVVNCSGPSGILLDRLAQAAADVGVPYIDVSGDEPVHSRLVARGSSPTALLSAGAMPGLSSLVPRWMAQGFDDVENLTTYVGGLERCSISSTTDMLLSMGGGEALYGEPLAGWREGQKVSQLFRPLKGIEVPFVPDLVDAYPFFSAESERLASDLGLDSYDFWNIFAGERLVDTFIRHLGGDFSEEHVRRATADLFQAAEIDLVGRDPYYALVFQMAGSADNRKLSKTAAIRTDDAYRLIAAATALTVLAVIEGKSAAGTGFMSEMLDLDWAVSTLRRSPAIRAFEVVDIDDAQSAIEEGCI